MQSTVTNSAQRGNKTESKLALHLGGYQSRAKTLRQKIGEAAEALARATISLDTARTALVAEEAAVGTRLKGLRDEVGFVMKREREAQELYRERRMELMGLSSVNGIH